MNRYYCDLHIHSCLSPCGDMDMTPVNIVNMARLNGLDIIALTDHNTVKNCPAAIACGKEAGLLVLPGMELTTEEEAHVLCLFAEMEGAEAFEHEVDKRRVYIENRAEIFGRQVVMDAEERELEELPYLLTAATQITCFEVAAIAAACGGVALPAHIDRDSYSIPANLGFISEDMGFRTVEFSLTGANNGARERLRGRYPEGLLEISNSDAHYLGQIAEREHAIALPACTEKEMIAKLRGW